MTLQILEGRRYVRRDGGVTGPMSRTTGNSDWVWTDNSKGKEIPCWRNDGCIGWGVVSAPADLVAEWSEPAPQEAGPVRTETVTRMVIVPGVYGRMRIDLGLKGTVLLGVEDGIDTQQTHWTARELRALCSLSNSLAEALESQP